MEFHLTLDPIPFECKISFQDPVMLMGSCFTEHIYQYLYDHKFNAIQNPNGILFNPKSISHALEFYISNRRINPDELFFRNGLWNHWQFHSSLSHSEINLALHNINEQLNLAHSFLVDAKWLILTFGSAFVYELQNGETVSNCHKAPTAMFVRRMLSVNEIVELYVTTIKSILAFNPTIKFIFTVSPVRHLKEGFVENNRSKSTLILAIQKLTELFTSCKYFPSYELVIDDLRDYRFYAEDMVHPNYLATKYVWENFSMACIEGKTRQAFKELELINNAKKHRPMHPESEEHQKFRSKTYNAIVELANRFPKLDLSSELKFFKD
jgi:hypothetical protein